MVSAPWTITDFRAINRCIVGSTINRFGYPSRSLSHRPMPGSILELPNQDNDIILWSNRAISCNVDPPSPKWPIPGQSIVL